MAAHQNVNPRQLRMFMPVQEVIDTVHKGDYGDYAGKTPREQWETPHPEYDDKYSLRDIKLGKHFGRDRIGTAIREEHEKYNEKRIAQQTDQPITVAFVPQAGDVAQDETGRWRFQASQEEPELVDGHHRLAFHEKRKSAEIAVRYTEI